MPDYDDDFEPDERDHDEMVRDQEPRGLDIDEEEDELDLFDENDFDEDTSSRR